MPFDIATAAGSIGVGAVNNAIDIATNPIRINQQLKGQKKALQQQNAAQMDMWNRTNYEAQVQHLKNAGLNPALEYGMGGGGGVTAGSASAMPTQTGKSSGMDIAGAAQIMLMKAQTRDLNASAAEKESRIPGNQGVPEVQKADIANKGAQTALTNLQSEMQKIQNNISDVSQWYHIGKIEADWQRAVQEYRSSAAKANVDTVTQETQIKQAQAELITEYITQKALKTGIQLDKQKIQSEIGNMIATLQNADTNKQNAGTGAGRLNMDQARLLWEKTMKDVPESQKIAWETIQDILQAVIVKGAVSK
ncbi:MAG: DNA pilot protein [Microviridae sp.]|nr:MAG: DNA pilot protein [Microviridae sp.]